MKMLSGMLIGNLQKNSMMYFKFLDALKNKIFSSEFLRLKDSEIKKLMVFISKTEYENFIKSLF
jgi:hypothetical protein